jgi:hypothetical protein
VLHECSVPLLLQQHALLSGDSNASALQQDSAAHRLAFKRCVSLESLYLATDESPSPLRALMQLPNANKLCSQICIKYVSSRTVVHTMNHVRQSTECLWKNFQYGTWAQVQLQTSSRLTLNALAVLLLLVLLPFYNWCPSATELMDILVPLAYLINV